MAIPHIYFKDYGNALFFCPSYTEQLQYARLLFAIDSKLSAEQNIKTNISLQKQYLLREMFIWTFREADIDVISYIGSKASSRFVKAL